MKKSIFYIAIAFIFISVTTSCTTDSFDKEMEQSVVQSEDNTSGSTDPIIIPKKD